MSVNHTNFAWVQHELRRDGIIVTRRDGEYRVNYRAGKEATAYYTDDVEDAYWTGCAMVKERSNAV